MDQVRIMELIRQLDAINCKGLYDQDFLLTWEHPTEEIKAILTLAETLKQLHQAGYSYRAFDTGLDSSARLARSNRFTAPAA